MGNGSSASGTTNIVQVQPGASNRTSNFSPSTRTGLAPSQPSYEHPTGTAFQNPHKQHQSQNVNGFYQPPCNPNYYRDQELDDELEAVLAPKWVEQQSKRMTSNSRKESQKNGRDNGITGGVQGSSTNDEIIFEVYHNLADGRDYTLINTDDARFYLDSWTTGEWQPFPDEWLDCGYIESVDRDTTRTISTSDVQIDGSQLQGAESNDDDRMSFLDHPTKGQLTTYFMEERCNIHCVFDPASGAWLKLPISWELHSPEIKKMIDSVQEAIPTWNDRHEILALLRQCNYDCEDVVATFLSILQDDYSWRSPIGKAVEHTQESNFDLEQQNEEIKRLKRKVAKLEALVKSKDEILEESLEVERRLKSHLENSDTTIRDLQVKVTCLERDLRAANKRLAETMPILPKPLPVPTPVGKKIAPETIRAVRESIEYLSQERDRLRNIFSTGRTEVLVALTKTSAAIKNLQRREKSHGNEIEDLRMLYHKEALHRKLLYNKLQELRGNIRVFCRCRHDPGVEVAVKFPSDQEIQTRAQTGLKVFLFDHVFTPASTQEQVFEDTLPLITSCVDGYNVCIMAYGQTGSGKTFTMMGPEGNPGVNTRSILELLRICNNRLNIEYTMSLSMLEVYNETLRDLLAEFGSGGDNQLNIQVRGKQVVVQHLAEIQVNSAESIKKIMAKGDANRSVGETKMNTTSSRSHLVLILRIQGVDQVSHAITHGTLTLVDLAGSERISKTEATGQRLVEAAAINKSLSALGQVFTALRTNAMHVPYRNSKLTQLLQGALGGDGKACLFVNVSPAERNLSETLSTLQFGSSAKQVQLGKATQNITRLAK